MFGGELSKKVEECSRLYKWVLEAIPWLRTFVNIHSSIYRGETQWADGVPAAFTTFPLWLEERFDNAANFKDPDFTLHKICHALMGADTWTAWCGKQSRPMATLFGMVRGGLVRSIKVAADTFEGDIAVGFVTQLCIVFNAFCADMELDMRMMVLQQPGVQPQNESERVLIAAVRIENQHGIASAKYGWKSLSNDQRRSNVLRGRLARSGKLKWQGQAQILPVEGAAALLP